MKDLSDLVKELDIKGRQLALRHTKLKEEYGKLQQKHIETEAAIH